MLFRAAASILLSGFLVAQDEAVKRKFYVDVQAALALKAEAVVADIGTGDDASHPLRIAAVIGETGRVVRVDIKQEAFEKLKSALPKGIKNIEVHLANWHRFRV